MSDGTSRIYASRAVERMTGLRADQIGAWVEATADPGAEAALEPRLFSRDEVQQLIVWAGGDLSAAPQRGGGPVAAAAATRAPDEHTVEPIPRDAPRLLILLAERDQYAADLTEYFLRTEGYRVETVFTVQEAAERFDAAHPDLAIVELLMEGGAGFELAQQLAGRGVCPVIVVSPLDASQHPAVAEVAAFLRKPLAPIDLATTVRDLLGTSSLVQGDDR